MKVRWAALLSVLALGVLAPRTVTAQANPVTPPAAPAPPPPPRSPGFELGQNSPNPFTQTTVIPFTLGDPPSCTDGGREYTVTLRIFKCLKPVIAAVNGPAVGIGVTMQLAMDIRIASEAARFGFVFSQRGIVPEAASSWFLPRIVGISQALEWCYTGRVFPAQEALAGRLVSKDQLVERLCEWGDEVSNNAIEVYIHRLRKKIEQGSVRIATVRGLGYCLERIAA